MGIPNMTYVAYIPQSSHIGLSGWKQELRPLLVPASASPELLRETFQKHGVCVVTGVLSQEEPRLFKLGLYTYIHKYILICIYWYG